MGESAGRHSRLCLGCGATLPALSTATDLWLCSECYAQLLDHLAAKLAPYDPKAWHDIREVRAILARLYGPEDSCEACGKPLWPVAYKTGRMLREGKIKAPEWRGRCPERVKVGPYYYCPACVPKEANRG